MPHLGPQRRQRLLQRGETRVRRSAARQLQRQVGERRRHEADARAQHARLADCARAIAARRAQARAPARGNCRSTASTPSAAMHQRALRGAVELDLDQFAYALRSAACSEPCTCVTTRKRQRILHAARRAGRHSALPSSSARNCARPRLCPGAGRAPCTRGSSGDRFARKPSSDSAIAARHRGARAAARRRSPARRGRPSPRWR